MKPLNFDKSNRVARVPKKVAPNETDDLHVYVSEQGDGELHVSLWQASWWERLRFLLHGRLWLFTLGQDHPPMSMSIIKSPFVEGEPQEPEQK